ncbi:MAG: Asp-tRNA(Asn)/Glu-tRNA(Gln) amidotransferase subunit GatC [Saprospiraceae bacterium]|nr:Asp-tRNA(Asn)/Glu-tRNA(Gln) amidotransferase subunit GatC [Saprospiraceae bacterium]
MQIDEKLILKLENLARLELSQAEREKLRGSLNDILVMVDKLNALDTEGVEPLVYINEAENVWREDVVKNELTRTDALKNAPDHNAEFSKCRK